MDLVFTAGKFINYRQPEKHLDGEPMFTALVIDVSNGRNMMMNGVDGLSIEHLAKI